MYYLVDISSKDIMLLGKCLLDITCQLLRFITELGRYLDKMKIFLFSVLMVTVITVPVRGSNIALNRPVAQSSQPYGGAPERAVDGNRGSDWFQAQCTHTYSENRAWWQVDLGDRYDIKTVTITNRGDCCGDRLKDFYILVSDVSATSLLTTGNMDNACHYQASAVGTGETRTFTCGAQTKPGFYVIIMMRGEGILTLCEVEVDGKKVEGSNIALNRPVAQSTVLWGGEPERAVDGNRASDYNQNSCTHHKYESRPWWEVDLGATYDVKTVTITNRGDCCADRLKNFYIFVSDVDARTLLKYGYGGYYDMVPCHYQESALGSGETQGFTCSAETKPGRYVIVMLKGQGVLTLCEVEVYL